MTSDLPQAFGRYQVEKLLGRGAMGTVYLAHDPEIGRKVAIKNLEGRHGLSEAELAHWRTRFEREYRSAGIMTHPNIVSVYDVGRQDGNPFIAMELVEGGNLEDRLDESARRPFGEIIRLATEVGNALDFAHAQGIVHRDIKPANIMFSLDGVAKVGDFGIAKDTSSTLTQTGAVLGTPHYMSPEQVKGEGVTGRADQFSLAVILYQMLTGKRPFVGDTYVLLYAIVFEEPTWPHEVNEELPEGVDAVLRKALAKNQDDRFDTCTELAVALRGALTLPEGSLMEHTITRARGADVLKEPEVQRDQGNRKKLMVAVAAALVVIAVVGGVLLSGKWGSTPTDLSEESAGEVVDAGGVQAPAGPPATAPESETIVAHLVIDTQETGLEVRVDGRNAGVTTPGVVPLEGLGGESRHLELLRNGTAVAAADFQIGAEDLVWQPEIAKQERCFAISSGPEGAGIAIDGEPAGKTPTEICLEAGGVHQLVVGLDGYNDQSSQLIVDAAEQKLYFPLRPSIPPGTLKVSANYPVLLTVDGRNRGTQAGFELALRPGKYEVELSAPDVFYHSRHSVDLASGEEWPIQVPAAVPINVTARPGNCRVTVDGQGPKELPLLSYPVAIGMHNFEFFWPATQEVQSHRKTISSPGDDVQAVAQEASPRPP